MAVPADRSSGGQRQKECLSVTKSVYAEKGFQLRTYTYHGPKDTEDFDIF